MGKDISFKNHDRFIHLGIAIAQISQGNSRFQLMAPRAADVRAGVFAGRDSKPKGSKLRSKFRGV